MVGRRHVHADARRSAEADSTGSTLVRVEDAPASRSEADYNFISNEIFVGFDDRHHGRARHAASGFFPGKRTVTYQKLMTSPASKQALTAAPEIGAPDYSDEGMLQYLRTERIIPPYQTQGLQTGGARSDLRSAARPRGGR